MNKYKVSESGFYGEYGGAFVPEMLYPNVEELKNKYLNIINTDDFQREFNQLLNDYVGRPNPLYFAKQLWCMIAHFMSHIDQFSVMCLRYKHNDI